MKIARVSDGQRIVTIGPSAEEWQFFNFRISMATLSFLNLLPSAFATPARYLMELFRRLLKVEVGSTSTSKLLFNPLFGLDRTTILLVLERVQHALPAADPTIFCDEGGIPLAYLLPPSLTIDEAKYLSLVSTVDASVDQNLLNSLFAGMTIIERIPKVAVNSDLLPHFYGGPYFKIYKWVTTTALETIDTQGGLGEDFKKSIPFSAIMPHHAGDLLFLSLASQLVSSHISGLVINKAYADIVRANAHGLNATLLDFPPLNRGGMKLSEWEYFDTFESTLPRDSFYYYARPTQNYDKSKFHLIDQLAFALGKEYCSVDDLLIFSKPRPDPFRPEHTSDSFKILLHFDSGWALKTYPRSYQEELVKVLLERGHKVTVLDSKDPLPCPSETFTTYKNFVALLKDQHILVGMDSFPAHYAAHVLGLPTLCLFSSTRPANSNAPVAENYRHLENGLGCCPCQAVTKCPLNGREVCNNFSAPETVAREIEHMLRTIYRDEDRVQT
jgi:hypothetical protein